MGRAEEGEGGGVNFGSLFAGVGGFDLGFSQAGMKCSRQVAIDPHCQRVRARHWPDVPCYDDVTKCGDDLGAVDVLCGGFPCQDLSVAGKRTGLAGDRSGLFYEMMRICDGLRPAWIVWENVPGLFSSPPATIGVPGEDFLAVALALDGLGYSGAWTTLDARYFGVAQRRRRIFGVFTRLDSGARRAAEVLALAPRMSGNPPPRRETRESVAGTLGGGASGRGRRDNPDSTELIAGPAYTVSPARGTGDGHGNGWNSNYVPALRVGGREQGAGDSSDNTPICVSPLTGNAWADQAGEETKLVARPVVGTAWKRHDDGTGSLVSQPVR